MKDFQERYIVQDLETFEFLCPDKSGGIEQTPYIALAGKYEFYEDAFEAGTDEIGGQFAVFKFFERAEV